MKFCVSNSIYIRLYVIGDISMYIKYSKYLIVFWLLLDWLKITSSRFRLVHCEMLSLFLALKKQQILTILNKLQ